MPRFAVVCALLASGCFFDADYRGGHYTCTDGACPSGFSCIANECVEPRRDAATDVPVDMSTVDARQAALVCADPGVFPAGGGTFMGTTAGRSNTVTAMCSASVMNAFDAVYRVDAAVGAHLLISVTGFTGVSAYVIAPCSIAPATPSCLGGTAATPGNPINVTTSFAGQHFIVVDSASAAASGAYTLTLNVN
jgi:hypothetical protein